MLAKSDLVAVQRPSAAEIESEVLDFLGKYAVIQPNNLRYFMRVFETFDVEKKNLLDVTQFRAALKAVMPRSSGATDRFDYLMHLMELVVAPDDSSSSPAVQVC